MSGIKYQFRLNEDVQNKSKELLIKTFQRSMVEIQNLAKMKAPVDTGNLRNSIQLNIITDTEIIITSFANYSAFIEYGTIYMQPQPFMRPAIDEVRFKELKKIAKQVDNELTL